MSIAVPKGFLLAGVHCRIKADPRKPDLALIMSEVPATAAGVYTQNVVHGAPIALNRQRTPSDRICAVVINSGNANACTGERGREDARREAAFAAAACGGKEDEALVLSTGVIGEFLPMDKIEQGISAAAVKLGRNDASLESAARGMMTTDTAPKLAGRTVKLADREIQITGLAKGAAMIGPNMATMLAVILTDAPLVPDVAQKVLFVAVDNSFNCISVEGHMSTSDSVLFLANGRAGGDPPVGDELAAFQEALDEVCVELAKMIVADGEGTTHRIALEVTGCADRESARKIARTVANSALVKTAVAGADPNWGRIVSAAGYADVSFDPAGVCLAVNDTVLYRDGVPVDFDADSVSHSMRGGRDVLIRLELAEGDAAVRFWTTDLTAEYVRLNADYHT